MSQVFPCGPVEIEIRAQNPRLESKVAETLNLYDVLWREPRRQVAVIFCEATDLPPRALGNYLVCARMQVDTTETGLYAVCRSGVSCSFRAASGTWLFLVPRSTQDGYLESDIDDLLQLVLTTSWRGVGWVPLHAGGVARGKRCLLLCSPSGGGKSTLAVALLRRGWKILSDDKLLLQYGNGRGAEVGALSHTLNLHPESRKWFPEMGDLTTLPAYSVWTEKRRIKIDRNWPGGGISSSQPTDLVQISRGEEKGVLRLIPLARSEVLSILLRQTVVPTEKQAAGQILNAVAPTASILRGWKIEMGRDAYTDGDCLSKLEEAFL